MLFRSYEGDGPEVTVENLTSNTDNRHVGDRVSFVDDGQAGCRGKTMTGTVISVQPTYLPTYMPSRPNPGVVQLRTDAGELTHDEETELIVTGYEQAAAEADVWATLTEGHEDRRLTAAIAAGEEALNEEMLKL